MTQRRLPEPYRFKGACALAATAVTAIVVIFGVVSGIAGL
jgi:hypothetical protein